MYEGIYSAFIVIKKLHVLLVIKKLHVLLVIKKVHALLVIKKVHALLVIKKVHVLWHLLTHKARINKFFRCRKKS